MNIKKEIEEIGSQYSLRLEQWQDSAGYWRAGLNWYGEDNYEYICEHKTIEECLKSIKDYIAEEKPIFVKGLRPIGDMPELYVKLEDSIKLAESETLQEILKKTK